MDFEGWEILPEDGYPEIQYDGSKKIFSRKYGFDDPNNLYKNNYFICPSQDSSKSIESTEKSSSRVPKQPLPVPIQLSHFPDEVKDVLDSGVPLEADHDPVSQVFFKKMSENKSADIKMDSPKSNIKGLIPQMDPGSFKDEVLEDKNLLEKPENEKIIEMKKDEVTWGEDSGGMDIFKLSLNGLGAICSFGVVAASICIIFLGGRKQNKQNHKAQFHIFAEDKRIKQVVQHATRLNEAIAAMRGVPGVRAHITVGGYYEGL